MTRQPLKYLASYAYFRSTDMSDLMRQTGCGMLFGDSGAHSARTLGITLTLDGYAAWCKRWDEHLTVYANLDVIGAPQATWNNQQALERQYGLTPLPVFHTSAPWHWLDRYLDNGYTYIAMGKLLGNPVKPLMKWLDKAFTVTAGRAVFHGFGMTTWSVLKEFPFYSVDSTTWTSSYRWGMVSLFTDTGRFTQVDLRDPANVLRHRELIRAHGADPAIFANRALQSRAGGMGVNGNAWRRAEDWLRIRHGPVDIPRSPRNPVTRGSRSAASPGLHLYLAESCVGNLVKASNAIARTLPPALRGFQGR